MNKVIVWMLIGMLFLAACSAQTATEGDLATEESAGDRQTEPALAEVSPTPENTGAETTTDEVEPSDSGSDDARSASVDDEEAFDISATLPEDVLIVLQRSGGLAGVDERWVVFADGRVEGPDGLEHTIDIDELEALMILIKASRFSELADSYVTLDTCCDRFIYGITVNMGDGKSKTVTTIDGASEQPEELNEVLNAIGKLLFAAPNAD